MVREGGVGEEREVYVEENGGGGEGKCGWIGERRGSRGGVKRG